MSWEWFHRLGSPRWFYEKTSKWIPWLGTICVALLVVGAIWGLGFTPEDAKQGNSFRIIYIHVPSSILAMAGYYVMAIAGAIGLIWKIKLSFVVMRSAATIGAGLTFLSLFTGAIWGMPTWGTWWEWDARIMFTFILLLLYLGIIVLHEANPSKDAADKVCAILALVGTVNVPIIYKSVDWWYSLHQPATIKVTDESTIAASMAYPLIVMIVAYYLTYSWALILHVRAEILLRERKTRWVQDLVAGK